MLAAAIEHMMIMVLLQALVPLLAEEEPAQVQACWTALAAVTVTIQRDLQASYVRTACEAVSTAREKVRRRRKPGPQLVPGFCLPRALEPLLPLYLQGVLQVSLNQPPAVWMIAPMMR